MCFKLRGPFRVKVGALETHLLFTDRSADSCKIVTQTDGEASDTSHSSRADLCAFVTETRTHAGLEFSIKPHVSITFRSRSGARAHFLPSPAFYPSCCGRLRSCGCARGCGCVVSLTPWGAMVAATAPAARCFLDLTRRREMVPPSQYLQNKP